MNIYLKFLILSVSLFTFSIQQSYTSDLRMKVERSPVGPGIEIKMPTKTATDNMKGIELPLLDNDYETKIRPNFIEGHLVRIVTTEEIYLYRVFKAPTKSVDEDTKRSVILGFQGTWLTNLQFKNRAAAMSYLALLPEWYRRFGTPDTVAVIRVPKGTELYVGNAGPQTGAVQIAPQEKPSKGNKKDSNTQDVRDYRLGGGIQIMVPPKNFLGKIQLTLDNIEGQFTLVDK